MMLFGFREVFVIAIVIVVLLIFLPWLMKKRKELGI